MKKDQIRKKFYLIRKKKYKNSGFTLTPNATLNSRTI